MAKKIKETRELTCEKTGKVFTYSGVGRPPKYHPEIAEAVRKQQRADAQKAKRKARSDKKRSETQAALAA